MTCTSMQWKFIGIPCGHVVAVATIYKDNGRLNTYVDPLFSEETFLKFYEFQI